MPLKDRRIVLDEGFIVEQGSHDELLRLGGHHANLWRHQSGGFLAPDIVPSEIATGAATETATEPCEEPPSDEMRADAMPKSGKDDVPVVTRA